MGVSITPILVGLGYLQILLLFFWDQRLEDKQMEGPFKQSIYHAEGITSGFAVRFLQMAVTAAFSCIFALLSCNSPSAIRPWIPASP